MHAASAESATDGESNDGRTRPGPKAKVKPAAKPKPEGGGKAKGEGQRAAAMVAAEDDGN